MKRVEPSAERRRLTARLVYGTPEGVPFRCGGFLAWVGVVPLLL